jgi:spoIIIJ-associated protein
MERTMKNEVVITATTVEMAIEQALEQLGAQQDDVEIEVLKEPVKRFFGESTEAEVRVSLLTGSQKDKVVVTDEHDEGNDTLGEDGVGAGQSDEDAFAEDDKYDDDTARGSDEGVDESEEILDEKEKNFNEVPVQLSDEELDIIADTAIEAIHEILSYFGVQDASIDEYEGEEGELILDIVGDNLAVLIGRHGKTLDSFQFLVSSIVGKKTGYRHPIIVDVEGYKHRRKQKLISIAKSSAARAIRQKHEVNLRPMSPYERRVIHVALKDDKRVVTSSEGIEPARYVVIRLV